MARGLAGHAETWAEIEQLAWEIGIAEDPAERAELIEELNELAGRARFAFESAAVCAYTIASALELRGLHFAVDTLRAAHDGRPTADAAPWEYPCPAEVSEVGADEIARRLRNFT